MLGAALAALEADLVGFNELAPASPAVADLESLAIQVFDLNIAESYALAADQAAFRGQNEDIITLKELP
jgi:hypothetical protein